VSELSGSTPFVMVLSLARTHMHAIRMRQVITDLNTEDILFTETYCFSNY